LTRRVARPTPAAEAQRLSATTPFAPEPAGRPRRARQSGELFAVTADAEALVWTIAAMLLIASTSTAMYSFH
jgi:hypothetical protein